MQRKDNAVKALTMLLDMYVCVSGRGRTHVHVYICVCVRTCVYSSYKINIMEGLLTT